MGRLEPHSAALARRQYSFGEFTLDLDGGFLRRGTDEVPLRPKPFEVLVHLVERHGRLVTKRELTEAVWPDTAVMDNSLAQCLVEIRRALGDDSQRLIRTIARRGYVFTAPVTTPALELRRVPDSAPPEQRPVRISAPLAARTGRGREVAVGVLALPIITAVALWSVWPARRSEQPPTYTQITNFADAVVSPALSPDGRMLAFIRSDNWFLTPGQIYVKLLPNGEPVQITHDPRPKYGPAFSPDGTRIVYTVAPWSTYAVSPLGGEPSLFLANSSGVTWLDERRILFSEVNPPRSVHMGVVTALEDRSQRRTVYFPKDERGMVHLSYASPDRKWVLVLEMNPVWQPCRVVPLDGSSSGHQVGPQGSCTSAAWSPDGKWMYFGVDARGGRHLWRQRFPDGQPEQITFGPTEEDGIAVAPDGRSLITSVGTRHQALWIHDGRGDRALSLQGYVSHPNVTHRSGTIPVFSRDGQSLFYLRSESPGGATELWRADMATGNSERALPNTFMQEFDISDDASEVIYSVQPSGRASQLWIAALDRRSAPQPIASAGGDSPYFGPDGRILYRWFDGTHYYLHQIDRHGSAPAKVVSHPIGNVFALSPDRRWITTAGTIPGVGGGTFAVPLGGGAPRRICSGCRVMWSRDGQALYLVVQRSSLGDAGKIRVVPLRAGEMLPALPPSGMRALDDPDLFPGSYLIDAHAIAPGPNAAVYAYVKTAMHRNLFRIPLP